MSQRYNVGVLGATGLVGQRLVERLEGHPWFRLGALAASNRSAGSSYADAADWRLSPDPPQDAAGMVLRACVPEQLQDCDLVLSALAGGAAREVEEAFVQAGFAVVSNNAAFRQEAEVPLLVPELNSAHLALLERQRVRNGGGYIVTNPNCSTTGLVMALAPIHRAFGLRRVVVATMQAVSGAGSTGPRALQLLDNVVPHIPGEEEKMGPELCKILGEENSGRIVPATVAVSAHCSRVPILDGHLEAVSMELERPTTPEGVAEVLRGFEGDLAGLELPSAPNRPLVVRDEIDRPQPALDRNEGGGMSVVVGRIRSCPAMGLKLVLLSHNTVRGAAGGTLLNAELLASGGLLPRRNPR